MILVKSTHIYNIINTIGKKMNNLKESKRKKLYNLLGKLPERSREISSELISEQIY